MHNDLMLLSSVVFFFLLSLTTKQIIGQQTTIYVKRGDTADICDHRPTSIYAYEYRSFDGKKNSIIEPLKHVRYSNPDQTSLLRITNVTESDSGFYKCPQDDTEWQKLQVYLPVQYVQLNSMHISSHVHTNDLCGIENNDCIATIEGQPLDVICTADGYPRPEIDITIDRNGSKPTIMALATTTTTPALSLSSNMNMPMKSMFSETYRLTGLKPEDNGRNITCHASMKQIDKNLTLSSTKKLYIEFAPKVLEKSKKIYCGINHTRTINCTVLHANPPYIRYAINGLSSSALRRTYGDNHDLQYTFDITPTSTDQFGVFSVSANNSIGFDTCTYELIHGGVPDAITHCHVDRSSNITITISCTKSYAQGDSEGYACTLFKYNDKSNQKMFEEIARTKSCIFALENFIEPVEFRVAAFNRYGSLPVNTYGYISRLNQPTVTKETPVLTPRRLIILGSVIGGVLLLFLFCCVCSGACHRDPAKSPTKSNYHEKTKYARTSDENEELKPATDDTIAGLVRTGSEKRIHQNGTVYDIPAHLINDGQFPPQISSTPNSSAYHQQRSNANNHNHNHLDQDSLTDSSNSIPTRTRTFSNKFYGHPVVDSNRYGPLSPSTMVVPSTIQRNRERDEEEEGNESPVYSTTTDVMSESGSFLVPSSSKRYGPPPPKPRYSTLSSVRIPYGNAEKTPLPKPRSRSNSRTRLNNLNLDNGSLLYEERPVSSSDSGMGQSDVIGLLTDGAGRNNQQVRYQTLASAVRYGTEC